MNGVILVVDDEREIANLVSVYLSNEGFEVCVFYDPLEALSSIGGRRIDLALLDVMMPKMDGFELLRRIREKDTFPVIMLTAKDEQIDMINGLALGADDYIVKPFRPLELVARVKAQLRRYTHYNQVDSVREEDENMVAFSGLVLRRDTHSCMLNERQISLTPIEFSILWYLCKNRGKVISSDRLFEQVWGEKYYTSANNTVMVHIRHLREKMHESAEHPKYIKTVWGVGYKIE